MTNPQAEADYDRAVEATARGETVPNLNEIIAHSRFCRNAFDSHVKQERERIAALSAPRPPSLGWIGQKRAAEILKQLAAKTSCSAQPSAMFAYPTAAESRKENDP